VYKVRAGKTQRPAGEAFEARAQHAGSITDAAAIDSHVDHLAADSECSAPILVLQRKDPPLAQLVLTSIALGPIGLLPCQRCQREGRLPGQIGWGTSMPYSFREQRRMVYVDVRAGGERASFLILVL
jgi:hypothetical protein